jgi:hypothetical protein
MPLRRSLERAPAPFPATSIGLEQSGIAIYPAQDLQLLSSSRSSEVYPTFQAKNSHSRERRGHKVAGREDRCSRERHVGKWMSAFWVWGARNGSKSQRARRDLLRLSRNANLPFTNPNDSRSGISSVSLKITLSALTLDLESCYQRQAQSVELYCRKETIFSSQIGLPPTLFAGCICKGTVLTDVDGKAGYRQAKVELRGITKSSQTQKPLAWLRSRSHSSRYDVPMSIQSLLSRRDVTLAEPKKLQNAIPYISSQFAVRSTPRDHIRRTINRGAALKKSIRRRRANIDGYTWRKPKFLCPSTECV